MAKIKVACFFWDTVYNTHTATQYNMVLMTNVEAQYRR